MEVSVRRCASILTTCEGKKRLVTQKKVANDEGTGHIDTELLGKKLLQTLKEAHNMESNSRRGNSKPSLAPYRKASKSPHGDCRLAL